MDSTDESSTDYDCDDGSISTNAFNYIWNLNQINQGVNAIYSRLKTHDRIIKAQSEWEGSEPSTKSMGKVLHKVFKDVVKKLNNWFP